MKNKREQKKMKNEKCKRIMNKMKKKYEKKKMNNTKQNIKRKMNNKIKLLMKYKKKVTNNKICVKCNPIGNTKNSIPTLHNSQNSKTIQRNPRTPFNYPKIMNLPK